MKGAMVPLPRFETCVHRFEKKEGGSLRLGFTMWLYTEKEEGRAMGCSVPVGVWGVVVVVVVVGGRGDLV